MIPLTRELRPCGRCSKSVLWTVTRAGQRMAVDPTPDDRGNQACYRAGPRVWHSRSLDAAGALPVQPWEHRYIPHVATCTPPVRQEALPIPLPLPPNVVRLDRRRRRRPSR